VLQWYHYKPHQPLFLSLLLFSTTPMNTALRKARKRADVATAPQVLCPALFHSFILLALSSGLVCPVSHRNEKQTPHETCFSGRRGWRAPAASYSENSPPEHAGADRTIAEKQSFESDSPLFPNKKGRRRTCPHRCRPPPRGVIIIFISRIRGGPRRGILAHPRWVVWSGQKKGLAVAPAAHNPLLSRQKSIFRPHQPISSSSSFFFSL
jgi:hypothetical protein